jgi:hypothetical protein
MYGGSSLLPKLRRVLLIEARVGERCKRGEAAGGNLRGVLASENVGISSEKTGENPVRRKPKVS